MAVRRQMCRHWRGRGCSVPSSAARRGAPRLAASCRRRQKAQMKIYRKYSTEMGAADKPAARPGAALGSSPRTTVSPAFVRFLHIGEITVNLCDRSVSLSCTHAHTHKRCTNAVASSPPPRLIGTEPSAQQNLRIAPLKRPTFS